MYGFGKKTKLLSIIIGTLILIPIFWGTVSAISYFALSDQGTDVKEKSSGDLLTTGNLTVEIYDSMDGGNLLWSDEFNGSIVNGSWNVILGEDPTNNLTLNYSVRYFKDYKVNGEDVNFTDYSGAAVGRKLMHSPMGPIKYGSYDAVTMSFNGSLGIGTVAPQDPLHIIADSAGDNIHLEEFSGGEDWQIGIDSSGNMNFEDEGTRRISIQDGTGRMFIGTGTPEWLATGLHVETADSVTASFPNYDELVLENTGNVGMSLMTDAAVGGYCFGNSTDSLVSLVYYEYFNKEIGFYVDNAVRMVIESTGEVGIGTQAPSYQLELSTDSAAKLSSNTWTVTSDERVKTNINDFQDGLDVIMDIRPVTYEYNGLGGYTEDGKMKVGIIAQELQPVAPYMIDKVNKTLYPDDEEETELLNYNGHALAFVTVNAIQEQQEQIESLQAENDLLKAELCQKDPTYSWCSS